jgi:hypothetical protein
MYYNVVGLRNIGEYLYKDIYKLKNKSSKMKRKIGDGMVGF